MSLIVAVRTLDDCVVHPVAGWMSSVGNNVNGAGAGMDVRSSIIRTWLPQTTVAESHLPTSSSVQRNHHSTLDSPAASVFAIGVCTGLALGVGCGIAIPTMISKFAASRRVAAVHHMWKESRHHTLIPRWNIGTNNNNHHLSNSLRTLRRQGYTVGYSDVHRSPLWVSFLVTTSSATFASQTPRAVQFVADRDIPKELRWNTNAFRVKGYDRGHLAPHAAVGCCRESSDETFLLSNIALQHPNLNRRAWKQLEGNIRRHVLLPRAVEGKEKDAERMLAVTVGPIFDVNAVNNKNIQQQQLTRPLIPKSFYMAIYEPTTGDTVAYVADNDAKADCRKLSLTDLESMLVSSTTPAAARGDDVSQTSTMSTSSSGLIISLRSWMFGRIVSAGPAEPPKPVMMFQMYRAAPPAASGQGGWVQRLVSNAFLRSNRNMRQDTATVSSNKALIKGAVKIPHVVTTSSLVLAQKPPQPSQDDAPRTHTSTSTVAATKTTRKSRTIRRRRSANRLQRSVGDRPRKAIRTPKRH